MFLDDQEPVGVINWELDRLARAIACPVDALRSLIKQDVLKGAPAGENCEPYLHVDRRGKEHLLIPAQPGPIWYSSAVVRDEYLRQVASKSGRRGGGNPVLSGNSPIEVSAHSVPPPGGLLGAPLDRPIKVRYKGAPKGVSGVSPPEVSPPITPSSLPPSSLLSTRAREEDQKPADSPDDDLRQQARDAFDRWSFVNRGYGIRPENNEHRPIAALIEEVFQEPPIIDGKRTIGRHLLIPRACDVLAKKGTDFKRIKYACGCVKNLLDDWSAKGLPGAARPSRQTVSGPRTVRL